MTKVRRRRTLVIEDWWRQTGSNRRPPACKAGALPAELCPHEYRFPQVPTAYRHGLLVSAKALTITDTPDKTMVGLVGFEPTTPALSRRCSNRLSYRPLSLSLIYSR